MGVYVTREAIKVGMFDTRGHFLHLWQENNGDSRPASVADKIQAGINYLVDYRQVKRQEVRGAGVTLDGDIDSLSGTVRHSSALGWRGVPFKELLEGVLKIPAVVDDYLTCVALAEAQHGAGWGKNSLILVDGGAEPELRLVQGQKPVRGEETLALLAAAREEFIRHPGDILPLVDRLLTGINPEVIVFNGLRPMEDEGFWADLNRLWQDHVGRKEPGLLPAELGDEAPLMGAAGLARSNSHR